MKTIFFSTQHKMKLPTKRGAWTALFWIHSSLTCVQCLKTDKYIVNHLCRLRTNLPTYARSNKYGNVLVLAKRWPRAVLTISSNVKYPHTRVSVPPLMVNYAIQICSKIKRYHTMKQICPVIFEAMLFFIRKKTLLNSSLLIKTDDIFYSLQVQHLYQISIVAPSTRFVM